MATLVATVVNPIAGAGGVTATVEVRTKADLPSDPPRASFTISLPLESNVAALKAAVETGVKQAYQAYIDAQAASARATAVQTFLAGKTLYVEV